MPDRGMQTDAEFLKDREIATWLAEAGLKGVKTPDLLVGFGERLNDAGVPVVRGNLGMETLHPQVRGYNHVWRRDVGLQTSDSFTHQEGDRPDFLMSPIQYMLERGIFQMRRRLDQESDEPEFPIFRDFRDAGMTEWYGRGFLLGWSTEINDRGQFGVMTTWTTDRADGFGAVAFDRLEGLLPLFALAVKSTVTREIAESVVGTYLGGDAGDRVLRGEILRGSVQAVSAVLFYADLRGFTRLADTVPRNDLVTMLDDYLDRIATPVEARGGQVLKFLGDGLLATFALDGGDAAAVCETALAAAGDALKGVDEMNRARTAAGAPVMDLDIALHMGEVLYGNVGSANRLDFTVIGPAVNEASRIEALCEKLDVNLLISNSFNETGNGCGGRLESVGRHTLRGVREAQDLFTVRMPAS